jgi:pyrroline-5-carboxylate reductase
MNERISFIGCGNMGEALLKGILKKGIVRKTQITAADISAKRLNYIKKAYGVNITLSNKNAVRRSDIVILCTKPQDIGHAAEELETELRNKLVISIAAGITLAYLKKKTKINRVIRAMPNTPALVGYGITALSYPKQLNPSDIKTADKIFGCVGKVVHLDERFMDAETAIASSGTAYFFLLMEAMMDAAIDFGIKKDIAEKMVAYTALGSAILLHETKTHPSILRQRVTSKGGTTEAALKVFSARGFERIVKEAIKSAHKRAGELSG